MGGRAPEIFTPENARRLRQVSREAVIETSRSSGSSGETGRFETPGATLAIIRAMAAGLKEGDGGRHLFDVPPETGGHTSAEWFQGRTTGSPSICSSRAHGLRPRETGSEIASDLRPATPPSRPCYRRRARVTRTTPARGSNAKKRLSRGRRRSQVGRTGPCSPVAPRGIPTAVTTSGSFLDKTKGPRADYRRSDPPGPPRWNSRAPARWGTPDGSWSSRPFLSRIS